MKKSYFLILGLLLINLIGYSQKIKGNKIPETKATEITDYKILEIGQNFEVLLVQQEVPRVRVETDENLHQYVSVKVEAEKLEIRTTLPLTRFKKLYVEIGYNESINQIIANDEVVIRGNTSIYSERMELIANDDAEVELHFEGDRVDIKATGKSNVTSNIESDNVSVNTNDSSNFTGEITSETIAIQMSQRSDVSLTGSAAKCNLFLNDSSELENSQFICSTTEINIKGKSKASINVTDKLKINANGNSETYIIGNPLMSLDGFNDEAKLIKMEIPTSSGIRNLFSN